jgi:hypothetical protein
MTRLLQKKPQWFELLSHSATTWSTDWYLSHSSCIRVPETDPFLIHLALFRHFENYRSWTVPMFTTSVIYLHSCVMHTMAIHMSLYDQKSGFRRVTGILFRMCDFGWYLINIQQISFMNHVSTSSSDALDMVRFLSESLYTNLTNYIFVHRPYINSQPTDPSAWCDKYRKSHSLASTHSVSRFLVWLIWCYAPCSIRVIEEAVTPRACPARPKRAQILVSITLRLDLWISFRTLQFMQACSKDTSKIALEMAAEIAKDWNFPGLHVVACVILVCKFFNIKIYFDDFLFMRTAILTSTLSRVLRRDQISVSILPF